jgi:hypothetical protein
MNGANGEKGFAEIWALQKSYLKLKLTITMVNYGV